MHEHVAQLAPQLGLTEVTDLDLERREVVRIELQDPAVRVERELRLLQRVVHGGDAAKERVRARRIARARSGGAARFDRPAPAIRRGGETLDGGFQRRC